MLRAVIEGASGYSGIELTRLLARHPEVELVGLTSTRWAGQTPRGVLGLTGPAGALVYRTEVDAHAEVAFLCTPEATSETLAPAWRARGARVIDLSRALRASPEAVYGLTEHARPLLRGAELIANPGCYPTAIQLALKPLVAAGLLGPGPLVIDAKSGVTGAGRKLDESLLFSELAQNHYPYRVGGHQHVPEIERGLGREVVFTPHLIPVRRGLLATSYVPVRDGATANDLVGCLERAYAEEPLVQVVTPDLAVGIGTVVGTPLCRVAVGPVVKSGVAVVFGSLDNLLKGAASQAVQNLNQSFGLEETLGIL
jgi:N-acetyl-gamma-glutamyl-phosphate reductase